MNDIDKVRVMLPHWIEHNRAHKTEFSEWADKLVTDTPEVAALLHRAVAGLDKAQTAMEEALDRSGGPLEHSSHHGHHHHVGKHHH